MAPKRPAEKNLKFESNFLDFGFIFGPQIRPELLQNGSSELRPKASTELIPPWEIDSYGLFDLCLHYVCRFFNF